MEISSYDINIFSIIKILDIRVVTRDDQVCKEFKDMFRMLWIRKIEKWKYDKES